MDDYCVYSLEYSFRCSWELVIVKQDDVEKLVKCVEAAGLHRGCSHILNPTRVRASWPIFWNREISTI